MRLDVKNLIKCIITSTMFLVSGISMSAGAGLSDGGFLVGATAEVGSSTKEGLFNWKGSDNVQTVIKREFGLVQTTAYPAWGVWTGSAQNPKTFDFTDMNKVINWAETNNKKSCIHLIVGSGTYFPAWFNTGNWTTAQVEDQFNTWITSIVTTNGNNTKVDIWNVVNEPFTWDGKYWPDSTQCRWQQLGWEDDKSGLSGAAKVYTKHPVYIRKAFEKTRSLTSAKLELRDYYIEFWDDSKKAKAFYQLVKHLKNSGVPIDAVGFQGHFRLDYSYDWNKLNRAVKEYKALGLEVYINELDYGDTDHIAAAKQSRWTTQLDNAQATAYHDLVKAAVSGGADWLCMWGVADNTNQYWRMGQNALLFNEQYQPKKAYDSFKQGIIDGKPVVNVEKRDFKSENNKITVKSDNQKIYLEIPCKNSNVTIFDVAGKCVKSLNVNDNRVIINDLTRGMYFIQMVSSGKNITRYKFIR